MKVAYYISGHGYGHATRVVNILNQIKKLKKNKPANDRNKLEIFIVTNAPQHLFDSLLQDTKVTDDIDHPHEAVQFFYRKADIDAGVYQPNAYSVDAEITLQWLDNFYKNFDEKLKIENDFLKENSIKIIFSDAPFLPM